MNRICGYTVQIDEDREEVCIIPQPGIPTDHYKALCDMFDQMGYKWWLPSDHRCGLIFSKREKK